MQSVGTLLVVLSLTRLTQGHPQLHQSDDTVAAATAAAAPELFS